MRCIYLLRNVGMSTNMLASKMQDVAGSRDLPIEVKAFSDGKTSQITSEKYPGVILLGSQVRYRYAEVVEKYSNSGIPIQVIDQTDYRMMNSEKVLKLATKLIKSAKQRIAERPGVLNKISDMGEIENVR